LISIRLTDPRERELPNIGLITLQDAETGECLELDTGSRRIREKYADLGHRRELHFRNAMRRKGLDWIEASTTQPYLPALRQLFARRSNRH
jgi:hypothetical protein